MPLVDPLALALWDARANARVVRAAKMQGLDSSRALAIASELYGELVAAGARQVGWKLMATDERAQAWLGTDRTLIAPVFSSSVIPDGAVIRLHELVSPRVELEIGFRFVGQQVLPLACVEVADSRFDEWRVTASEAIADFALQGRMIFGPPRHNIKSVDMKLLHNGNVLAVAFRTISSSVAPLTALTSSQRALAAANGFAIAAGSVVAPVPLTPGSWRADFGALGALSLKVTP